MNNFTAFLLGALLAIIIVAYVFFGSESKTNVVETPPAEAAASTVATPSSVDESQSQADAPTVQDQASETQPEEVTKTDTAPAAEAPASDAQEAPAPETQKQETSPAPTADNTQTPAPSSEASVPAAPEDNSAAQPKTEASN
ncbi:MAG: hypothetical protein VX835_00360 [Pseudomonadota bacterium]|nr:hypothetical protein [Pseudomonadota bacterium]